jgi:alkylation response protein AidB-like acyl-CoA dehydrogenase
MDYSLTEEQEMLRKMARDFLSTECPKSLVREMAEDETGHPIELWDKMSEIGWLGLVIPEQYGGGGGSFFDLVVLLEEMGRACLPGPFFSTAVLGGLTLLEAGSDEQKQELLPKLAQGKLLMTLALTEASAKYTADGIQTKATQKGDDFFIQGTKIFVPDAHISNYLICAARTKETKVPEEGITLFLVDSKSPGINYTLLKTISGDKQCEVVFDNVKVPKKNILGELNEGWPILERVLEKATIARCAEMVGASRQVLEMTVDYAKQRIAFGHPIGSFQGIQFYCANMLSDADASAFLTYQAACRLSEGFPAAQEVAMAKAWVSEKLVQSTTAAHRVHGAIGFCEDHDLPLYFKRAKAWEASFGGATVHLDKIATAAGI